jgi:Arc/MetJ-type ribon-helix-helix transcriptional regulator
MNAKNPTLTNPARGLQYALGDTYDHANVTREDIYPHATVEWRGATVTVEMRASRYTFARDDHDAAPEWSDWRIYVERCDPWQTDTARGRIADAVRPLVQDWLQTRDYHAARASGLADVVRAEIRESNYSTDRARLVFDRYRDEMHTADVDHLGALLDARDTYNALQAQPLPSRDRTPANA